MVDQFDPKSLQAFFENMAQNNVKAWEAQTRYLENMMKRNTGVVAEITASQVDRIKQLAEAGTAGKLPDATELFDKELQDKLSKLYEQNQAEWETLQEQLKALYAVDNDFVKKAQADMETFMENAMNTAQSMMGGATKPAKK